MENISFDDLKQYITDYLSLQGIFWEHGKHFRCLNPRHSDKHPSMSYDPRRKNVHCFACGVSYDLFDLIELFEGISDKKSQLARAKQLYGKQDAKQEKHVSASTEYLEPEKAAAIRLKHAHEHLRKTNYLLKRGISINTALPLGVGYDPASFDVLFPTHEGGYEARTTNENNKIRIKSAKGCAKGLFHSEALSQNEKLVFVVEGPFDALSVMEAGGIAVALCGVGHIHKFLSLFEKIPKEKRPVLAICLDHDDAGKQAQKQLTARLDQLESEYILPDINGEYKDPNAALLANKTEFFQAVVRASTSIDEAKKVSYLEKYNGKNALKYFINGLFEDAAMVCYHTGFEQLDVELGGGLREGLYVLGAMSGLGKTTLAIQMADYMARHGQHVLVFTLEMARTELIARSISRNTYMLSLAKYGHMEDKKQPYVFSTIGITAPERWNGYDEASKLAIAEACQDYETYAENLFYIEGIGDINAQKLRYFVEKHKALFNISPVVIVDYLQLLASTEQRYTDKQNMDKVTLELKRISRDYKIPVIAVSSFNRSSYNSGANMAAFKESGAIEYSSDVLLGLQLRGQDSKSGKEISHNFSFSSMREMELKILKNRNGRAGGKIALDYYARFNFFEEPLTKARFIDLNL